MLTRLLFIGGTTLLLMLLLVVGPALIRTPPLPAQGHPATDQAPQPSPLRRSEPRETAGPDPLSETYGPRPSTPSLRLGHLFEVHTYADPATGGSVPLLFVEGLEEEFLSPHFQIEDLIGRDGAPYARISPDLVKSLEHILWLADAPIHVNSAYRHPAHNADPSVGGVPQSQHLAGLAADIWSPEKTPGELAEIALDVTECTIGLGLGRSFIHIDLRGRLASWVQPDAALDEAVFDAWVRDRCAALKRGAEKLPAFGQALAAAKEERQQTAAVREDRLITTHRRAMAAFAEVQYRVQGPGAVILDLRQDSTMKAADLPYRLSYVLPGSPEAQAWDLDALIRSAAPPRSFAFTIIQPDGATSGGAMSYGANTR